MLVARGELTEDARVFDLPRFLRPGDRLVLNNTRVIPARLSGLRHRTGAAGATEARIEVTLLEPRAHGAWAALVNPSWACSG